MDDGKSAGGRWKVLNHDFGKYENRTMESADSVLSLTENQTTKTTEGTTENQTTMGVAGGIPDKSQSGKAVENKTVKRLVAVGVMRPVAMTLWDRPLEAVEDVLSQAYALKREGELKSLPGFVVAKLREYSPTENPIPQALSYRREVTHGAPRSDMEGESDDYVPSFRFEAQLPPDPVPTETNPRLDMVVGKYGGTAQSAWAWCVVQMKLRLDRDSLWHFERARLADYVDGVFVVKAASPHGRDILDFRLGRTMQSIIGGVAGDAVTIRVECDVVEDTPQFLRMSSDK